MASTYLTRTPSSETANGRRKWTLSFWWKWTSQTGGELFGAGTDIARNNNYHILDCSNTLKNLDFSGYESAQTFRIKTNRKFRDINAWYHIVIAWDTTQATASDRIKLYVNGVQETSFLQSDYPSQNFQGKIFSSGKIHSIGGRTNGNVGCLMSHFHACEGYVYSPSAFGETDANGVWTIKTSPSVTYGTNGFFILKDGNSVTDQSGNSNNFTVAGGTLTNTEDNPSNVFATYNGVFNASGHTLSRGNTQATVSGSNWIWRPSTLGATTGKYYAEIRVSAAGGGTSIVGITNIDDCTGYAPSDTHFGKSAVNSGTLGFAWYSDDGKIYYPPNASTSVYGTWGASDILMLAMDLDNGAFYIGKNGSWLNSGNPASGASKTGAVRTWTAGTGTWVFADAIANGSVLQWNWGNGIFGKNTPVSSAGTNASGIGIFEYDVPTGYTALSTKGLNL